MIITGTNNMTDLSDIANFLGRRGCYVEIYDGDKTQPRVQQDIGEYFYQLIMSNLIARDVSYAVVSNSADQNKSMHAICRHSNEYNSSGLLSAMCFSEIQSETRCVVPIELIPEELWTSDKSSVDFKQTQRFFLKQKLGFNSSSHIPSGRSSFMNYFPSSNERFVTIEMLIDWFNAGGREIIEASMLKTLDEEYPHRLRARKIIESAKSSEISDEHFLAYKDRQYFIVKGHSDLRPGSIIEGKTTLFPMSIHSQQ